MEESNAVKSNLESKLMELSSASSYSQAFIFMAPRELRQVNERAFEPQIISIGPYHQGKDHLKAMEIHKVRYLSILLQRGNDLKSYITYSKSMEEEARDCYAETVKMSSEEFVTMMVLDGLFVVELIQKFTDDNLREANDNLFKHNLNLATVAQDLLLLENQLPFFVLQKFADMTGLDKKNFVQKALHFFTLMMPTGTENLSAKDRLVNQDNKHLLGLVRDNWLPSGEISYFRDTLPVKEVRRLEYYYQWVDVENLFLIRSATELVELGIRFKKRRGNNSLFDITFAKGQMHIPPLIVNHNTERIFRNLIAYEQFNHDSNIVMDYARLMDCLIKYADDVALLCDCGIIYNRLGSNEDVAIMFNKLNDYVYLFTDNFYYSNIFYDVKEHCGRRWNLWKVELRHKYLVLTSFFAATFLLLLTLVQTIFSVIAYFK